MRQQQTGISRIHIHIYEAMTNCSAAVGASRSLFSSLHISLTALSAGGWGETLCIMMMSNDRIGGGGGAFDTADIARAPLMRHTDMGSDLCVTRPWFASIMCWGHTNARLFVYDATITFNNPVRRSPEDQRGQSVMLTSRPTWLVGCAILVTYFSRGREREI